MKGFNISSKKKWSSFSHKENNNNNNNFHRYYNKNNNKSFGWKNTKKRGSKFDGTYRNDDENDVERSYEDIYDYIINISYILNEKYEKYLIYEMRDENINKGNKAFHHINLDNTCYYIEDDICILLKVIEEIKNNEIKIFDHRKGSKIMEKLIYYCFFLLKYNEKNVKNEKISMQCIEAYNNLLRVVSRYFMKLTLSNYGSHVIQSLLCLFPYFNKYEYIYIDKLIIQNVEYNKMYDYFKNISDLVCDHLFEIIFDRCGTHVLRSFLYSLGGYLYINISNITFRKSKINKNRIKNKLHNNTNSELKYVDKNFQSNNFYEYIHKIVERISNEIEKPNISLKYKNLLYQYVYYDKNNKNENEKENNNNNINNNNNCSNNCSNNIMEQNNTKNVIPNIDKTHNNMNNSDNLKYIAESNSQHFICPLLYNTYSVPALVILFELLNDKNIECSSLISQIFLINKTKLYYIEKTKEKDDVDNNIVSVHVESPLKQLLDILIVLDNSSIMIEKLLKIKNEETFYIFNMYILKNVNKLICENIYSNMVLCNYFTNEYISEEMFDLLIKNIHIEQLIKYKTFNILKCLFFLAQWYKRNCRYLFNELIKNFHLNDEHKKGNSRKFMWICILCMCNYDDLPSLVRDIYINKGDDNCTDINSKEQKDILYNKNNLGKNINNYNFYNYLKIDINGYYILSYLLSFPKESITNLTNSFKYFCNFIKTVNINEPSSIDVENYQSFMENFSRKTEEVIPVDCFTKHEEGMHVDKNVLHNNDNIKTKMNNSKPFYRKNIQLRGNILLYFSCDKNLSILCEKIVHTFNLVNEKYLRRFITLFQNQYNNIAKHYIGAHTIVTFFKLGDDNIKKNILDSLIQNDINVYNNYIKNFMKLKEYQKTKTLSTNNKKYLKAKKLFEDILMSKENGQNQNDINHKKEHDKTFIEFERIHKISKHLDSDLNSNDKDTTVPIYDEQSNDDHDNNNNNNNNILKEETNDDEANKENDQTYDNVTKSYKSSSNEKEDIVDNDNGFMNIITDYIKNTKTKSRKRKKEKDQIDNVLKRK
ncbi:hypothetical protein PFFVO_04570 [Plasmodium falciparum Vietnam Oak-Knoll (FVO)]|uniref:Uncharacterized protein n=1 Tax=Plasmodium falciparum Vietnam Oak-Knoll (FVO) TaxID=1036723 RepID=A0A024V1T3_PLAFA|nr:hypothetical protein PFFVO_04570 [Plasmodium falciparum Vietnam Oak-Knoll (FVO)]